MSIRSAPMKDWCFRFCGGEKKACSSRWTKPRRNEMADAITTGAVDELISVETQRAREIWKQKNIPVVFRPGGNNSLMVKFPVTQKDRDRDWLHEGHRKEPAWHEHYECWIVPRSWFEDVTRRLLQ